MGGSELGPRGPDALCDGEEGEEGGPRWQDSDGEGGGGKGWSGGGAEGEGGGAREKGGLSRVRGAQMPCAMERRERRWVRGGKTMMERERGGSEWPRWPR